LFRTPAKHIVSNIDSHMTDWKVIALIDGEIKAVSEPAAQHRPETHESIIWEGEAADKAGALQSPEIAPGRSGMDAHSIREGSHKIDAGGSPQKLQPLSMIACPDPHSAARPHFPRLPRCFSTYFPMLLTVSTQTLLAGSCMYLQSAASAVASVT